MVVATGGGVVLRPRNVDRLRAAGTVIWLSASPETLKARIQGDERSGDDRPPLSGTSAVDEVDEVLASRVELYRRAGHFEIPTDELESDAVVERILEAIGHAGLK